MQCIQAIRAGRMWSCTKKKKQTNYVTTQAVVPNTARRKHDQHIFVCHASVHTRAAFQWWHEQTQKILQHDVNRKPQDKSYRHHFHRITLNQIRSAYAKTSWWKRVAATLKARWEVQIHNTQAWGYRKGVTKPLRFHTNTQKVPMTGDLLYRNMTDPLLLHAGIQISGKVWFRFRMRHLQTQLQGLIWVLGTFTTLVMSLGLAYC